MYNTKHQNNNKQLSASSKQYVDDVALCETHLDSHASLTFTFFCIKFLEPKLSALFAEDIAADDD